jgi:hypothetical protein
LPQYRVEMLRRHSFAANQRSQRIHQEQLNSHKLGKEMEGRRTIALAPNLAEQCLANPFTDALAVPDTKASSSVNSASVTLVLAVLTRISALSPWNGDLVGFANTAAPFR